MKAFHKKVKNEIAQACACTTPRELFTSGTFSAHLEDIAAAQCGRYGYDRRVRMDMRWDETMPDCARTNNREIMINAGHALLAGLDSPALYVRVLGLFAHELGHVLYTDFADVPEHTRSLAEGRFFPFGPDLTDDGDRENAEWLMSALSGGQRPAVERILQFVRNIVEDGYVERRITEEFPGTLGGALAVCRKEKEASLPDMEELDRKEKEGRHRLFSVLSMLLSYALFGNVRGADPADGRTKVLLSVAGAVDAAMNEHSGRNRYGHVNAVMLGLCPLIRDYLGPETESGSTPETESEGEGTPETGSEGEGTPETGSEGEGTPETESGSTPEKGSEGEGSPETGSGSTPETGSGEPPDTEAELGRLAGTTAEGSGTDVGIEKPHAGEKGGAKIPRHETEKCSSPGGDGKISYRSTAQAPDKTAARELEKLVETMAKRRVLPRMENERTRLLQAEANATVYGEAHKGIHVRINRISDPDPGMRELYRTVSAPLTAIAARLRREMERRLETFTNGSAQNGLLYGKRIDQRSLWRDDCRIFKKNALPGGELPLAVGVLIDESGSMEREARYVHARASAIVLYEFCDMLGLPVMIYGHSTGYHNGKTCVELYSYAEFDTIDGNDRARIMDIRARRNNRDGAALRYMADRLRERGERIRLLITISDGQPADIGYSGTAAEADIRSVLDRCKRSGIRVVAAAIGDDRDSIAAIYGEGYLDITNPAEMPKRLTKIVRDSLKI